METNEYIILSTLMYKTTSLIIGVISIYLGYRLFSKGIWTKAGDLESNFKDIKLVIRSAAPGSFFAVLGAVIICVTILKGFEIEKEDFGTKASIEETYPITPPNLQEPASEEEDEEQKD